MRGSIGLGAVVLLAILITQAGTRITGPDCSHLATGEALHRNVATRLGFVYGLMYCDALGNMAAQVMPGRARPNAPGAAHTDEGEDALTGYLAYFGSYSINERAHTITHHRKGGNINPGQIDDDAVRR